MAGNFPTSLISTLVRGTIDLDDNNCVTSAAVG